MIRARGPQHSTARTVENLPQPGHLCHPRTRVPRELNSPPGRDMRRRIVTTRKPKAKTPRRAGASTRTRTRKAAPAATPPEEPIVDVEQVAAEPDAPAPLSAEEAGIVVSSPPEPIFAARVTAPAPRPFPDSRRGIFFDVENTSRPEHVARVLHHVGLDWTAQSTELTAVGNWRVIGHETARLLAQRGAHLVHSAPSTGVRDWSDLRIAVAAGVWLASGRPGDAIVIISDDHAFDAVGDVAASLGVTFERLSYRALAGVVAEAPVEQAVAEPRPRSRRSRGGRHRPWPRSTPSTIAAVQLPPHPTAVLAEPAESTGHTAPHDELLAVVRELHATVPGGVNLDNLSNALKARGFARPPGSPRLITRLRRIKELEVARNGSIRLVDANGDTEAATPSSYALEPEGAEAADALEAPEESPGEGEGEEATPEAAATGAPRRRRRRGGRRRRGRGRSGASAAAPAPDVPL